jgi:hypothetical protein
VLPTRRATGAGPKQEEARPLARTYAAEALVRHKIGRRLFDEARDRDAAAEFGSARHRSRAAAREHPARDSARATDGAHEIYGQAALPDGKQV